MNVQLGSQTLPSFVAGDKGCLPGLVSTTFPVAAVAATPSTQTLGIGTAAAQVAGTANNVGSTVWTLAAAGTFSTVNGILADYFSLTGVLCQTYGTCCYTEKCNSAIAMKLNVFLLIMSFLFSKIYF